MTADQNIDWPSSNPSPLLHRAQRFVRRLKLHLIWVFITAALIGWPLYQLAKMGFENEAGQFTVSNFSQVFTDSAILGPVRNSFVLSLGTTVISLVIGMGLAYLTSRTDMPGKSLINISAVLAFATPSFLGALGWMLLLGPRGGMINKWAGDTFGLDGPLFNVMTEHGILFAMVTFYWPIAYLPIAAGIANIDPRLEEAAVSLGSSRSTCFWRITFPLTLPALAAGGLLVFVYSFMSFGPVAILGSPVGFETIPTYMYKLMAFPPRLVTAAVIAIPSLIALLLLVLLQRRLTAGRNVEVIGGKPGGRIYTRLGVWKWPIAAVSFTIFTISFVLPFGVLILTSFRKAIGLPLSFDNLVLFDNYQRLFDTPGVLPSLRNSLVLATVATMLAVCLAFFAAWLLERRPSRLNAFITPIMMLPTAFGGVILGVALILAYGRPPFALTGTFWILLLGYVISALPLTFIYLHAGMKQLGPDAEDVAKTLGANGRTIALRIQAPLLSGSILAAALLNFVFLFRELDLSVFLFSGTNNVSGVVLFGIASQNRFTLMGAMGTLLLVINLTVVILVYGLAKRMGRPPAGQS